MKLRVTHLCLIAFAIWTLPAYCQKVQQQEVPRWVESVLPDLSSTSASDATNGFYYILVDQQDHLERQESFEHYAYRFETSEGIQQMSDIEIAFDPTYQKLTLHKLVLHRNGKSIDQLDLSSVKTIQREQSMDRHLYDGTLSAILHLKDVRVGDVVEYAYTLQGFNPVYEGHFAASYFMDFGIPYERLFRRVLAPPSKKIHIHADHGENPEVKRTSTGTEYRWDLKKNPARLRDNNTPVWYNPYRKTTLTDFENWSQVNEWALKHYAVSSDMQQQLKSAAAEYISGETREARIRSAIRLVQDEIRYLGFESGLNSHKPHAPLQVLQQRFGDCKDKSLLLSSLLRLEGIEAYPVLVNTTRRGHVAEDPPSVNAFDHCVVTFELNDRAYYIDPTIANQGGTLEDIYFPTYEKGLVIKPGTNSLSPLGETGDSRINEVHTFRIPEVEKDVTLEIKTTYTGVEADIIRTQIASISQIEIQKNYLTYHGNLYPDIKAAQDIVIEDNRENNQVTVTESYIIPSFWKPSPEKEGVIVCEFYPLSIEQYFNVAKSTTRQDPYRLSYPTDYEHTTVVELPSDWTIENSATEIHTEFYEYDFFVRYDERRLTLFHQYKTLHDHVPANHIQKFVADHKVMLDNLSYYLTYDKTIMNATGVSPVALAIAIVALVFGAWLVVRLYRYDPVPKNAGRGESIGGWLILVAIGITLSPFMILYQIAFSDIEWFNNALWLNFIRSAQWDWVLILGFELGYNLIFLLYSILIAVLFYQRRSSAPRLIIIFYLGSLVITLIDTAASAYLAEVDPTAMKEILRAVVAAGIWVPYFLQSDRVKRTFVEQLNPPAKVEEQVTIHESHNNAGVGDT